MAQSSVMVSLPQMVDLALNCPEVGVVNFNILHSLLHVVIQQVDLLECKVEFRGNDSERVQGLIATSKPGPSLNLTEYIVTPGKEQRKVISKKKYKRVKKEGDKKSSKEEVLVEQELKVIDQRKDSKEEPDHQPSPLASTSNLEGDMQTVIVVEPTDGATTPHVSVALSRVHFDNMEEEIEKLKEDIQELKELPANMGLIEALRNSSVDKSSPVLDMFQILTLSKRIDATETGIGKLASMVEDLAREASGGGLTSGHGGHGGHGSRGSARPGSIGGFMPSGGGGQSSGEKSSGGIAQHGTGGSGGHGGGGKGGKGGGGKGGGGKGHQGGGGGGGGAGGGTGGGGGGGTSGGGGTKTDGGEQFGGDTTSQVSTTPSTLSELPADVKGRIDKLENRVKKLEEDIKSVSEKTAGGKGEEGTPEQRLNELENKFAEYTEQVSTLDGMFNSQINTLQTQFTDLEKEIGEIIERINAGLPAGDFGADQNISELFNKIVQMQDDMENMAATAAKLLEDKEERQSNMDAILEQIELLKTIKANREDLEDALADKADTCAVNRKVSHDQFDAACDDLSRGIEDALSKLTQQEQLWQQALDDIQREIENKLDKMELTPLRDFVHNKLKMLQERVKALAALKKETEAAGTKSKFLRNVNCISCDKDVIMRKQMDPSLLPPPPALPPTKSMGPYLAYELDALRKQQKCLPHGRNMNHFESAITGAKGKGDEDHICNRYCGGSHTVTTPQQRVARLGHFLQQWGPETQPISEGQIRGTDGQLYKSREGGDITPGRGPLPQPVMEDVEDYFTNMKSRPSMVVHGDILATRSTLRSAASKTSEGERPSVSKNDRRESQGTATSARRESQRVSLSSGRPRSSKDASSKRLSKTSTSPAQRPSTGTAKQTSHISFKAAEEGSTAPAAEEHPPSEAPPASEGGDAGSQAPSAGGGEAPPAEAEAEPTPAEEAPAEE
ncbi:hypothetical protein ILUMI_09953 [Ignelater luminosus]|uniref:DUF4795 domain-containing protein n=1 Tax=Ignelater luminosus TaxID=2038154 RepID=A0A8K0D459_IGNLU|nr:hypothetical protein ILUMI_09953 [Ignelater luminosus]